MCELRQFALCKWTKSIYKHKIRLTYCQNCEVYSCSRLTKVKAQKEEDIQTVLFSFPPLLFHTEVNQVPVATPDGMAL